MCFYGCFKPNKANSEIKDNLFLVEKANNRVCPHGICQGIENVVASSGTSLTDGQIKPHPSRFTNQVTVFIDGDAAW